MKELKANPAVIAILATIYFVAGKLGLRLALVHPSASAVWAPTGIALAIFLILGYRVWPSILIGAFLVNLTTAGTVATSIAIATGNTLEGLLGAFLVNNFAGGRNAFRRAQDIFKFVVLAGMLSTAVSATFGVTTLAVSGFASWANYKPIWLTWWLGDAVGAVVVAPSLILWNSDARVRWSPARFLEVVAFVVCLFLVGQIVFGGLLLPRAKNYPLDYLCIPFLIWVAFRFGQREAATATLMLSGLAIWGTLHGFGPFVRGTLNESLLLLQAFLGIMAVMTMAFAAVFAEDQRAEEQARLLAISDPLTGLANYRKLIDVLDVEIKRSKRTGRSFAVLLLDLDGLKKVNDNHGHLVGSRALCRLAEVLRVHCRGMDTAARYGGDEFALILPEAGIEVALQVARRISERLAGDNEQPPLSVSTGPAVFPQDGETIEALLGKADRAVYEMKGRARTDTPFLSRAPSQQ